MEQRETEPEEHNKTKQKSSHEELDDEAGLFSVVCFCCCCLPSVSLLSDLLDGSTHNTTEQNWRPLSDPSLVRMLEVHMHPLTSSAASLTLSLSLSLSLCPLLHCCLLPDVLVYANSTIWRRPVAPEAVSE